MSDPQNLPPTLAEPNWAPPPDEETIASDLDSNDASPPLSPPLAGPPVPVAAESALDGIEFVQPVTDFSTELGDDDSQTLLDPDISAVIAASPTPVTGLTPPAGGLTPPVTGLTPPAASTPAGLAPPVAAAAPAAAPMSPPMSPPKPTYVDPLEQAARTRRTSTSHITLQQLVEEAFHNGYSDIHLGVGEKPRFRDRGQMLLSSHPVTTTEVFYDWLRESLPEHQVSDFEATLELDTAIQYEGMVRCRVNVFVSLLGPAMVLRLIPLTILTMEQLKLPDVLRDIANQHKGLVLVTGPTGSGKSTTLAAMVDYINKTAPKHIISIEDPIEFVHSSQKSMVRQREVGIHTLEFANALKASLREDPDILLIGEMRDRETVDTALKAAQTGHLVFGTLHTNSAVKTIERLLNIYNPDEQAPMREQISESLVAIIAQTLVRTTDGKRAAAHEIMVNTDAIRDYIKRGAVDDIEALIPQCTYDGMQTMNQSLFNLYESGRIDADVAMSASPRPNEMSMMLRGRI
ncbi:MAG: PilT/PilU family type 4a pilus ATPase [Cyanobacteria bacterium P01_F01_bin.33]